MPNNYGPSFKPLGPNDVDSYTTLESMGRRIEPHGEQRLQYGGTGTDEGTGSLPVLDVDRQRRNFEGYEKNQWYNLAELKEGLRAGTTETDSKTETDEDHEYKGSYYKDPNYGYAGMQKSGKGGRPWKASAYRAKKGTN